MTRSHRQGSAPGVPFRCDDTSYHEWQRSEVHAAGRVITVASKPGVAGFGNIDAAEALLLEHMDVAASDDVCVVQCGSGAVAVCAAQSTSGRVHASDVILPATDATRRTLKANDITNATVTFGHCRDTPASDVDVVVARLPKGRIPTLQLIRDAWYVLRPAGRFVLAGANDEGIRSALRHVEQLFGSVAVSGYRSGHRVAVATRQGDSAVRAGAFDIPWLDPEHYQQVSVATHHVAYQIFSRPGVFAWDRVDAGTQALIDAMDVEGAAAILDLGCGTGIAGAVAATRATAAEVTLCDVHVDALRSSQRTVAANGVAGRCQVVPSDAGYAVPDNSMDVVVTNPPFHTGRATDLSVPAQFVRDAARVLKPGGRLFLVANRTLPYEGWIRTCFGACSSVYDGREYKVLSASRR